MCKRKLCDGEDVARELDSGGGGQISRFRGSRKGGLVTQSNEEFTKKMLIEWDPKIPNTFFIHFLKLSFYIDF